MWWMSTREPSVDGVPDKISRRQLTGGKQDLDLPLNFNTTNIFTIDKSDLRYVTSSQFAYDYWWNITFLSNNGLVTIPTSYALEHNLSLSGLPAPSNQTVLQVDVFHQLHCLERLRGFLTGSKFLYQLNPNMTEEEPYMQHTFHCLDYLRQAVLCQSDMTLVSTNRDLEFDKSPPRQCRDFEAVRGWVMRRRYDYDKYLNGIDSKEGISN